MLPVWAVTLVLYAALFVLDLAIVGRRPHIPTMAECLRWLGLYVGLAIAFGIGLWYFTSHEIATSSSPAGSPSTA